MASTPLIMILLLMGLTLVNSDSPSFGTTTTLRPLEPVPGTNLFYNIPYKWFDETKQGCFVTWLWEKFQDTKQDMNRGVGVVCNDADHQQWYNHTDSDWIIEHPKKGLTHTHGEIVIRNIGCGQTLERLDSAGTSWLAVDGWSARMHMFDVHTWNIISDPANKNRVQLEIDGKTVSQHPLSNYRAYLWVKGGYADGFPYSFSPSISLELKITNFEFNELPGDELEKHSSQKALIDAYTIDNNSPATANRQVVVSKTVKNEFSYSFTQSIKAAIEISGKVEIPLVAEGKVEDTFEVGLGANQNWKSSTGKTFQILYNVKVPPYTKIHVSAWCDLIEDVRMDFIATVKVYGKTQRITQFDDIVDVPATGAMVENQLVNSGFEGDILDVAEDHVIVKIKGEMTATAGIRGRLNLDGEAHQRSETA